MKKKKLYLDFNILIYLKDNQDDNLRSIIEYYRNRDYLIVFSPAHIEEIAVSEKRDNQPKDKINKDLEFISELTNNNALRPITRNNCILFLETPNECYERVIKDYSKNDFAELIEEAVLYDAHTNPLSELKEMNNKSPEDILKDIKVKKHILQKLVENNIIEKKHVKKALQWKFKDIQSKFYIFESYVDMSARYLEKLGFFREKKKKYRSRLHDVSHIIYSSYCDIFITNDKKLYNKTKAIYSLLKIDTKIYMKDEFVKMYNKSLERNSLP